MNTKRRSTLCLGADVSLGDMWSIPSDDGQCLLVYCRGRIVAILCAMGSDVEIFEFADEGRMSVVELIERIEPVAGDEPMQETVVVAARKLGRIGSV